MTGYREVHAVFFDIGGPIYDDGAFARAVLSAVDELRAERGWGPADRRRFREIYDAIRTAQSGSLRRALAAEFLGDAAARSALHDRTAAHWSHPPGSHYPDVLPCLRALRGRVRLGVIANQEPAVVDALRRDGVAPYLTVWAVSALVGVEKPDPALFAWACEQAGTAPEHAVHVGNRLDTDVRPAAALGMGTVWLLRGEAPDAPTADQRAEADAVLTDLAALPDVVFRLPVRRAA